MRTINLKTEIPENHKLLIDIPQELPAGPAEVIVIIAPEISKPLKKGKTAGDMLRSPLLGIWKDRKDITDSLEFARKLRKTAETRKHG